MASQCDAREGSSWENPIDLSSDEDDDGSYAYEDVFGEDGIWECSDESDEEETYDQVNDNTRTDETDKRCQETVLPGSIRQRYQEAVWSGPIEQRRREAVLSGPIEQRRREAVLSGPIEQRLRRFRPAPPKSFWAVHDRAMTQRFCVLGRQRGGDELCPEESFILAGSTGNVYTIRIARQLSCDCPHARKGNQCKHVIFVLARVLHAPFDLVYQLALLSTELRAIFAAAWTSPAEGYDTSSFQCGGKRRAIEGDCSICFCELESNDAQAIVWCRAACGQNFHRQCMNTWIRKSDRSPRCPMCRRPWELEEQQATTVSLQNAVLNEGYANVGYELGMPSFRDTSSYSQWYTYRSC
ncbi:hypothetical protein CP533_4375 [Ophiocordyceps camponoti-saundersi (nom. inval.)]|nr:hypothetical protein CP533_4375 [Ophiocordyceps camponoti-saundersi (nom. inval.)]